MKTTFRYIVPFLIIAIFVIIQFYSSISWRASDYLNFSMIVLTYFYVVFTYEMLNRLESQSYLEKRPYIIADFAAERLILKIYIKNIGKTPAVNVKIKIVPDIVNHLDDLLNETIFKNKIDFFPPEKKVETAINSLTEFFKRKLFSYQIQLSYEDNFGKKYNENINVDLNHIENQINIVNKTTNDVVKSLEKIAIQLKNNPN